MNRLRFLTHPIVVFVVLQVIWVAITVIWVVWFVTRQEEISQLAKNFGTDFLDSGAALASLIVGCILLGVMLVGTIVLFVFGQRQARAIRQQRSFLSSVTHELRSPLSSLQLAFETLRTRELAQDVRDKMLDMSLADISRLVRLVDQILVSARLDRGILMFQDEGEEISVADAIRAIGESSSYLDRSLPERLVIECSENLHLRISRAAFSLILGNLIENCVKYSPSGTPIRVTVTKVDAKLMIRIHDEGFGLTKSERRRVFRMFHRSESATKRAIPGTGLGLFIVRSAVQILGGKVWAESLGPCKGTTMCIDLPVTEYENPHGVKVQALGRTS